MDLLSRWGCVASACAAAAILAGCGGSSSTQEFTPQGAAAPTGMESSPLAPSTTGFTHYYVIALGTLGGSASVANSINDRGWIAGLSKISGNAAVHAVLWVNGRKVDLRTLGGPNSAVGWPVKNDRGEIAGFSDLTRSDPLDENFCGFGSPNLCAGFLWKDNTMTALPTLGGNNSFAAGVNDAGQIVGFAENVNDDPSCGAPQVLDYDGVIWEPNHQMRTLPPASGDAVSQAVSINSAGAAVGSSGPCGPPNNLGYGTAHALLWPRHGGPINLGTLGGTTANIAAAINDRGDVVGQSAVTGNTTYHAFYWQHGTMSDMGTLPGDGLSEALGLNDRKQAVGYSCDANGCRAFIWQNGAMSDLNLLVHRSRLSLIYAGDINDKGWIVGQAFDSKSGKSPAVLLIPDRGAATTSSGPVPKITLPESVRRRLQENRRIRFFIQ